MPAFGDLGQEGGQASRQVREGGRAGGRRPDEGEVRGQALRHHGAEQVLFGGEVEIERPLRHPGPGSDLVEPGGGEALVGEHDQGRRHDFIGAVGLAASELGFAEGKHGEINN